MSAIIDDKSDLVIHFIISRLQHHRAQHSTPFFIGLNGVQGVGKTTLVTALQKTLSSPPHLHPTLTVSIDDFYLPYRAQRDLAAKHPGNPLVQHRGQPSTHDVPLMLRVFRSLKARAPNVAIPSYDKSAHNGAGDQRSREQWSRVNMPGEDLIDVVIFEGWCVGFRPLIPEVLKRKWESAAKDERKREAEGRSPSGRLGLIALKDVTFVNTALRRYDAVIDHLDAFVYLDAEDTHYVYDWRLEQEHKMIAEKGTGMSDGQVKDFVDGYYPAYELYTDTLREGIFKDRGQDGEDRQLRLLVDKSRRVISSDIT